MIKSKTKKIRLVTVSILLAVALLMTAVAARPVKTILAERVTDGESLSVKAKSALLMDYDSGTIAYEQNSFEHLPIASMVKIMTLLIAFDEIEKGNLSVDTEIMASSNATSMGGSQAFLDTNSNYKLDELLKTIVVASANDSCVAVAEHISGSVESFVDRMNATAKELSMDNTNFVNCTGLPAPSQYCCANDVGIMTRKLISYDLFYKYSTVWMFDFVHPSGRITELSNTNKLIKAYPGCDGGKTGFTNDAMFCLSATCKRGNTRLISVVIGAETSKIRNGENAKLFNYGFANYETKHIVVKGVGDNVDYAVNNGKEKTVKLIPANDYFHFGKKNSGAEVNFQNKINPINAPVKEGQVFGEMIVIIDGVEVAKIDLLSDRSVRKIAYLDILDDMIKEW